MVLCLQVNRSAVSLLQKGRTDTVLPNGGGRLWALKDVTGAHVWDVMDSPATACGVLDVLLQDLAHIDLIGVRGRELARAPATTRARDLTPAVPLPSPPHTCTCSAGAWCS